MTEQLGVMLVGLGKQMVKDHLPAVLRRADLRVAAVVDPSEAACEQVRTRIPYPVATGPALDAVLPHADVDLAIVAVPHNQYLAILAPLAESKIPVLKEKPIATTENEALELLRLFRKNHTYIQICVQRRFSKLYDQAAAMIQDIGSVYSIYAEYTLNLKSLDEGTLGWRADRKVSAGGATLDLGYHTIDLLTSLFGLPDHIYARLNFNSLPGAYSIDDSMKAMMTYGKTINANMLTTKIFGKKGERVRIFGVDGFVFVDDRLVRRLDRDLNPIETHEYTTKQHEVDRQLDHFITNRQRPDRLDVEQDHALRDQLLNMRIIDAIYRSHEENSVIHLDQELPVI